VTSVVPPFSRSRRVAIVSAVVVAVTLLATACSAPSKSSSTTSLDSLSGSLTVSAASSLQGAFTDLKVAFEKAHPGMNVTVNFGASSTLAQQIIDGAPVDVFASADEANMTKVSNKKLQSGTPKIFATNSLEIIVRNGNPSKIASLADLSKSGLIYITCAPEVPIGKYGAQVLQKAGVKVSPASLEPDVKGIVAKVTAGEADAGIVYATDISATKGAADGVVIPADVNVIATYPIVAISTSTNSAAAQSWIAFVTGTEGQTILKNYGFGAP
jgi:molybdate transport system substrate-binding protein